jgi:hypothetical protein
MMITVFRVCRVVDVYRRFRGTCYLHHQGDDHPDDGGSKKIRKVGKRLPHYTSLQLRRQPSSYHNIPITRNYFILLTHVTILPLYGLHSCFHYINSFHYVGTRSGGTLHIVLHLLQKRDRMATLMLTDTKLQ